MAKNANLTTIEDVINPEVMADMIEEKLPYKMVFTPIARVDNTLEGRPGDSITVPRWDFVGAAETVAEGEAVTTSKMTASSTTTKVKKAMKKISMSEETVLSAYGDPVSSVQRQLTKAMALKMDNDVLNAARTATLVYDKSSAAKISYNGIVEAIDLFGEEIQTEKVLFVPTQILTELRKMTEFTDRTKYGNNVVMNGEIGMICGARVVPTKALQLIDHVVDNDLGTITIVKNDAVEDETNKHLDTMQPHCAEVLDVGNKVKVNEAPYYLCLLVQLEPESEETDDSEEEAPAFTVYLKRGTKFVHNTDDDSETHNFIASKHYAVALTNATKVVLAKFKQK